MNAHNVFQRFNTRIHMGLPNHKLLKCIDPKITRASVHAENKCCRRKPGYWTQELHQLKLHFSVWCQLKSQIRCRLPVTNVVHRAEQLSIPITTHSTLTEANDAIAKLRKSITAIHKESFKRQQEYVLDLANISEDNGDDKKAKIIREMAKQEQQHDAYARLVFTRGKTIKQQNIDRIQVPVSWPKFDNFSSDTPLDLQDPKTVTKPDDWREIKCPAEIELMLKLHNQKHFGQAEGTPFTREPLRSHFNWSSSTHQAEMVLHGNYSNRDIDHISQLLLESFTKVTDLDTGHNRRPVWKIPKMVRIYVHITKRATSRTLQATLHDHQSYTP